MKNQSKPQFQSPEWIIPKIQRDFSRNRNNSISACFRHLRNHKNLSLIGDYPILATVVNTVKGLRIEMKKQRLFYALNQSTELKEIPRNEKQQLIDHLLKSSSVQFSNSNTRAKNDLFSKDDTLLVQSSFF